jgi:hypothetical protein
MQKLAITEFNDAVEVEPAIVEVAVTLQDGSKAVLRMSVFTVTALRQKLNQIGG